MRVDNPTTSNRDFTASFPEGTVLDRNTRHWLVFEEVSGLGGLDFAATQSDRPAGGRLVYRQCPCFAATPCPRTPTYGGHCFLIVRTVLFEVRGYRVARKDVLVSAHERGETDPDVFLRVGTERVTKDWTPLPEGRTYDGRG